MSNYSPRKRHPSGVSTTPGMAPRAVRPARPAYPSLAAAAVRAARAAVGSG